MTLIRKLPQAERALLKRLGEVADDRGISLSLVGGVVRDLLLKRKTWDLDLTADEDGIAFAKAIVHRYGGSVVLFERFQTARIVFPDGKKVDITTARRESYRSPAALPNVSAGSLDDDLYRRDFTINAMAISLNAVTFGDLYDPFGGRKDLRSGIIRVLHAGSFIDDPTRIFRAIRFTRRFGFRLERRSATLLNRAAATNMVQRLSGPRLCREILLLLGDASPEKSIETLDRLHLMRFLSRGLSYGQEARRIVRNLNKALQWWRKRFPNRPIDQPMAYLAAVLTGMHTSVVKSVIRRLQLPLAQSDILEWSGSARDRIMRSVSSKSDLRPSQVYHLLEKAPDECIAGLLAGALAHRPGSVVRRLVIARLSRFLQRDRDVTTSITGDDLKRLGLPAGPRFRIILRQIRDAKIDGRIANRPAELELARRLVNRTISRGAVADRAPVFQTSRSTRTGQHG
ncbi:hypothetical protein W02_33990 [Nitrospira sp. KM1]|uniref:CCA tRNA nucleotidyltransferase n=1 Tax=Nitrospira sp. KM1 TaxID=1936990 RepID=UPI0013A76FF4|nr:CCA tRNA nucleotidyltransferase [Nitrospira sp. KM1]BCA56259.1 hypothetical protein W02_33990 [Nitrospira sp. KM1]